MKQAEGEMKMEGEAGRKAGLQTGGKEPIPEGRRARSLKKRTRDWGWNDGAGGWGQPAQGGKTKSQTEA